MMRSKRVLSLIQALVVTFLWSTSYILIKVGLQELNPLAFAAYRYAIASGILFFPTLYLYRSHLVNVDFKHVFMFVSLGFTGYFIAQGLQFFGLFYLPPVTVTFILNLTPIFVVLLSVLFLQEKPSSIQSLGMILTFVGVFTFFYDSQLLFNEFVGILLTLVSGVGWAGYMILSRYYLREGRATVIVLTTFSMLSGSLMLLGTTALTGNFTPVSYNGWVIILWLSIVNTAVAFALWNNALKTLRVYEQSILQNTMLIQISVLTFIFFNELFSLQKILGLAIVFIGVLVVQLGKR